MKTTEVAAVIQYILTATQSSVSQDYYNKFLMLMILGLAGALFSTKISRINKMNHCFFKEKYLFECAGKLGKVLKNRR